jgi:hypothetical protein
VPAAGRRHASAGCNATNARCGNHSTTRACSVRVQQKQSGTQTVAHESALSVPGALTERFASPAGKEAPSQWTLATSAQIAASNSIAPIRAHLTAHVVIVVVTFVGPWRETGSERTSQSQRPRPLCYHSRTSQTGSGQGRDVDRPEQDPIWDSAVGTQSRYAEHRPSAGSGDIPLSQSAVRLYSSQVGGPRAPGGRAESRR